MNQTPRRTYADVCLFSYVQCCSQETIIQVLEYLVNQIPLLQCTLKTEKYWLLYGIIC